MPHGPSNFRITSVKPYFIDEQSKESEHAGMEGTQVERRLVVGNSNEEQRAERIQVEGRQIVRKGNEEERGTEGIRLEERDVVESKDSREQEQSKATRIKTASDP